MGTRIDDPDEGAAGGSPQRPGQNVVYGQAILGRFEQRVSRKKRLASGRHRLFPPQNRGRVASQGRKKSAWADDATGREELYILDITGVRNVESW